MELLARYQGNVAHVARHLKRQYAVVWRCIQRYGIAANSFRPDAGAGAAPVDEPPPGDDLLEEVDDEDDLDAEPAKGS